MNHCHCSACGREMEVPQVKVKIRCEPFPDVKFLCYTCWYEIAKGIKIKRQIV